MAKKAMNKNTAKTKVIDKKKSTIKAKKEKKKPTKKSSKQPKKETEFGMPADIYHAVTSLIDQMSRDFRAERNGFRQYLTEFRKGIYLKMDEILCEIFGTLQQAQDNGENIDEIMEDVQFTRARLCEHIDNRPVWY